MFLSSVSLFPYNIKTLVNKLPFVNIKCNKQNINIMKSISLKAAVVVVVALTVSPMFLARVLSVMLANGLSAPQHSTYLVILLGDLLRPVDAESEFTPRMLPDSIPFSLSSSPFLLFV